MEERISAPPHPPTQPEWSIQSSHRSVWVGPSGLADPSPSSSFPQLPTIFSKWGAAPIFFTSSSSSSQLLPWTPTAALWVQQSNLSVIASNHTVLTKFDLTSKFGTFVGTRPRVWFSCLTFEGKCFLKTWSNGQGALTVCWSKNNKIWQNWKNHKKRKNY